LVDAVEMIEVDARGEEESSFQAIFARVDFFNIDFGLDASSGVAGLVSVALKS
jgi:hypothetical protein